MEAIVDDKPLRARPVAGRARCAFRTGLEARAGARIAVRDWSRVHGARRALARVVESDCDGSLEVITPSGSIRAAAAAGAAERPAEEAAEQVLRGTGFSAKPAAHSAEAAKAAAGERVLAHLLKGVRVEAGLLSRGTILVICRPLLVVFEGLDRASRPVQRRREERCARHKPPGSLGTSLGQTCRGLYPGGTFGRAARVFHRHLRVAWRRRTYRKVYLLDLRRRRVLADAENLVRIFGCRVDGDRGMKSALEHT
jgi:hypothetical protein